MNKDSLIEGIWHNGEIKIDGECLNPLKSQGLKNHSPDGFSWGYGGSGPSQLSLALLLEATNQEEALKWYQDFKMDYIAKLSQTDIMVEARVIYEWLEKRRKQNGN